MIIIPKGLLFECRLRCCITSSPTKLINHLIRPRQHFSSGSTIQTFTISLVEVSLLNQLRLVLSNHETMCTQLNRFPSLSNAVKFDIFMLERNGGKTLVFVVQCNISEYMIWFVFLKKVLPISKYWIDAVEVGKSAHRQEFRHLTPSLPPLVEYCDREIRVYWPKNKTKPKKKPNPKTGASPFLRLALRLRRKLKLV